MPEKHIINNREERLRRLLDHRGSLLDAIEFMRGRFAVWHKNTWSYFYKLEKRNDGKEFIESYCRGEELSKHDTKYEIGTDDMDQLPDAGWGVYSPYLLANHEKRILDLEDAVFDPSVDKESSPYA